MIAIYVRVSTNYQKINGFSIIQQIQKIQNYINLAFPGIESVIYEDSGYSGTTLNRPALQRLLNDISSLKISHVIYTSTDRLSRDIVDYDTLLTYFLLHKTTFICIDAPIETTNATQMLKSKIDVMFAEYEAQRISERTVEGIKGALRKGRYPFGGSKPPYGYRKRNGVLKIHRDESREIKKLFKRFADTSISMNELISHYSINPDINFPAASIPKILKNHIYCGFVVFHGEVFPLNNTQIISQALFDKVQEKMSVRSKKSYIDISLSRNLYGNIAKLNLLVSVQRKKRKHTCTICVQISSVNALQKE